MRHEPAKQRREGDSGTGSHLKERGDTALLSAARWGSYRAPPVFSSSCIGLFYLVPYYLHVLLPRPSSFYYYADPYNDREPSSYAERWKINGGSRDQRKKGISCFHRQQHGTASFFFSVCAGWGLFTDPSSFSMRMGAALFLSLSLSLLLKAELTLTYWHGFETLFSTAARIKEEEGHVLEQKIKIKKSKLSNLIY